MARNSLPHHILNATLTPARLYRWLVGGVFMLGILVAGGALALWGGAANPPRADRLVWEQTFDGEARAMPPTISQQVATLSAGPFSLEATASHLSAADPLAGWGLWLEAPDGTYLIVAVNGAQYITARRCPAFTIPLHECPPLAQTSSASPQQLTYWKHFHHIRSAGQPNHLRLNHLPDQKTGSLSLWINGEWMWDVTWAADSLLHWGLWQSAGTTVEWERVAVFRD